MILRDKYNKLHERPKRFFRCQGKIFYQNLTEVQEVNMEYVYTDSPIPKYCNSLIRSHSMVLNIIYGSTNTKNSAFFLTPIEVLNTILFLNKRFFVSLI